MLGLTRDAVDFDNLVIRVQGKGNKQRLVPMSFELRKVLWRFTAKHRGVGELVFGTGRGTKVTIRNCERDLKALCERAGITGIRCSPNTFRHSFAVGYLRNGGNIYYLSKILGHTSVQTTERYLRSLGIEDLRKVHQKLSLLSSLR